MLLRKRLPGLARRHSPDEQELYDELEYAGELMVVQFFSLIRTTLLPKRKKGGD